MKRFYVTRRGVFGEKMPNKEQPYRDLFISVGGAHWVDLSDGYVLLCCEPLAPRDETIWHLHREVARLHVSGSSLPLSALLTEDWAHKQFRPEHLKALETIGVTDEHTVRDVSDIASKIHPLVSLGEEY